jgi:phage tail-like protein
MPKGAPPDLVFPGDVQEAQAARDAIKARLEHDPKCPRRPSDGALIDRGQRALDRLRADRAKAGQAGGVDATSASYLDGLMRDLSTWLERLRNLSCPPPAGAAGLPPPGQPKPQPGAPGPRAPRPEFRGPRLVFVDIQGMKAGFSEVEGLSTETDAIDYRTGPEDAHVRRLPGLRRYPSIVLKRGWTGDPSLFHWYEAARNGRVERKNVTVTDFQAGGRQYHLFECWPTRWSGPSLNAKNSGHATEKIELVCERMEFR